MPSVKQAAEKYFEGVGRRKTSIARVRMTPGGKAAFFVNDLDAEKYFPTDELRRYLTEALAHVEPATLFGVTVRVRGGGIHSQAEAVRMGVARALTVWNDTLRKPIKKAGLLRRDPRAKERRKFGLKKARKAPQWSKR